MRMNDGCCDPKGRFWAGSMAYDVVEGAGSLYRTGGDGTVVKVLDGTTIVNGRGQGTARSCTPGKARQRRPPCRFVRVCTNNKKIKY